MSLPVAGTQAVELELHIGYWAGVFRPVALEKLALLLQMGQTNHQELMGVLRGERVNDDRDNLKLFYE